MSGLPSKNINLNLKNFVLLKSEAVSFSFLPPPKPVAVCHSKQELTSVILTIFFTLNTYELLLSVPHGADVIPNVCNPLITL